jgi:hypothetical protein
LAQACAAADLAEQLSEEIQTRRPGGAQPWCNPRTSCGQGHDRRQKFCRTNTDQARHQFRASARLCWPTDMSTKRRIIDRERKQGITPEAVAAWMACDWDALHCALGLNIWERSPLPREISGMGCSEDDLPEDADSSDAPLWVKGSSDLSNCNVSCWPLPVGPTAVKATSKICARPKKGFASVANWSGIQSAAALAPAAIQPAAASNWRRLWPSLPTAKSCWPIWKREMKSRPISLSDRQLETVLAAAGPLPPDKRTLLLERIGAMLNLRGRGHFNDADVDAAIRRAIEGLLHEPAA